jgi:hypothetical protein
VPDKPPRDRQHPTAVNPHQRFERLFVSRSQTRQKSFVVLHFASECTAI